LTGSAFDRASLAAAAATWDAYYRPGAARAPWHLDRPSPELLALLATGIVAPPAAALDIGCGAGTEAVHLAMEGFEVTALDVAPAALAATRRLAARRGVKLATIAAFAQETGLPDASFDLVNDRSCFHCLEPTAANLETYAREAARIVRPSGILFVRRFGQPQIDRSTFERCFADAFHLGRIQEIPFAEPHHPSRVAVLRRRDERNEETRTPA
jgi:SAM-dependent methyltransferase